MKKFFLFLLFVIVASASLFSQSDEPAVQEYTNIVSAKDQILNLGVNFLNAQSFSFGLFGATGQGDPSPSINLSYEYGLTDNISIAGFGDYYRVEASAAVNIATIADQIAAIDINDFGSVLNTLECLLNPSACQKTSVEERVNVFTLGGKIRYERNFIPGLDTYASTYLGYSFNRRKTITESAFDIASEELGLGVEVPTFVYYGNVGARYFFTEYLGAYLEFGHGNVHLIKLGTSYRFK